jgi:hypothetical protein
MFYNIDLSQKPAIIAKVKKQIVKLGLVIRFKAMHQSAGVA